MPRSRQSLALEREYATSVARLWRSVAQIVERQFAQVDPNQLERAFAAFVATAAPTISLGQEQAQRLTAAFVRQYVESETGRAFREAAIAGGIAGSATDGQPVRKALAGGVGFAWRALQGGADTSTALRFARNQVVQLTSRIVADSAERELSHQADRSAVLKGWTWVTFGDSCIACLAQQTGEVLPYPARNRRHNRCDCRAIPAVLGVRDQVKRPTGDELFKAMSVAQQEAIFKNAGSDKAELVRSGQASLADFVTTAPTAAGRVVTEAPLEAVA